MTRAEWFKCLATLAYPAAPEKAETAFAAFIPWFKDMPDAAFTSKSIDHVITAPRKMAIPSYDEIRKPLAAWLWEQKKTSSIRTESEWPALPGPTAAEKREPTDEEKAAVNVMVQSWKKEIAKKSGVFHLPEEQRPRALPLKDQALLAEYTAYANDERNPVELRRAAEIRVTMLLKKLGKTARVEVYA